MSTDCPADHFCVLHRSLIIGAVPDEEHLERVKKALECLGAEVDVLQWLDCAMLMENGVDESCDRLFGRMEHDMVQRYLDLMLEGQIVFGAEVEPDLASHAAGRALVSGAHDVVFYSGWIVTVYDFGVGFESQR